MMDVVLKGRGVGIFVKERTRLAACEPNPVLVVKHFCLTVYYNTILCLETQPFYCIKISSFYLFESFSAQSKYSDNRIDTSKTYRDYLQQLKRVLTRLIEHVLPKGEF